MAAEAGAGDEGGNFFSSLEFALLTDEVGRTRGEEGTGAGPVCEGEEGARSDGEVGLVVRLLGEGGVIGDNVMDEGEAGEMVERVVGALVEAGGTTEEASWSASSDVFLRL